MYICDRLSLYMKRTKLNFWFDVISIADYGIGSMACRRPFLEIFYILHGNHARLFWIFDICQSIFFVAILNKSSPKICENMKLINLILILFFHMWLVATSHSEALFFQKGFIKSLTNCLSQLAMTNILINQFLGWLRGKG